ncbi:adenylyl-sulfate kinase [Microbacterium sp. ZXX196]|uniref:adenylyl-sulfate kinase n=1 Tax=Microbacterium sp. ZXX196 TaxID=2609291 RepID=UPI0034D17520
MPDVPVTLSSRQLRRVELALAAPERPLTLALEGVAAAAGDTLVLHDAEGTDVAALAAESVEIVPPHAAETPQIGAGEAPPLPGIARVTGPVSPRRPLGHRDGGALRVGPETARVPRATLVTGTVPDADDAGWAGRTSPVIVRDTGDARALATAIAKIEAGGRRAVVLPDAGDGLAATLDAARAVVADDVDVWETPIPAPAGRAILLTGLSGSGKSTISKLLVERLAAADPRTVSLLDGDEVRLILSAGLGFSRDDRMLNVRRIGWVAALVAAHGGIAVCAPIAPYEAMRREMRERVEEVGRFLLVHISTPVEVCEARDRKGLYAKARAGQIPEFTGISDPYQVPTDADLTIDASVVAPDKAVDAILARLAELDA